MSPEAYTTLQRIHRQQHDHQPRGSSGAWKAAENSHSGAADSQAIEPRSQDKAGSTA